MTKRNETGLLIARVLIGLVFVAMGFAKLTGTAELAAFLDGMGFPAATGVAWAVALIEVVGGLSLVLGIKVRVVACGLAVYLVLTTLVHFKDYMATEDARQITNILKNVGILGGLTAVWAAPSRKANLVT